MTRINLIPPADLHDRHLVAEYRELPRIFALIRGHEARDDDRPLPLTYRMGTGHVMFFYDKGPWLVARQEALIAEMRRRGMEPNFTETDRLMDGIDASRHQADWDPSPAEIAINQARITERLKTMLG